MVKVILGDKGSGNTKELMKVIRESLAQETGSMVCIEKGNDLTYDVSHQVRLISANDYGINSFSFLKGFVSGLHGGNFDIASIFIDSLYKVAGSKSQEEAAEFLAWCEAFGAKNGVKFTISVTEAAPIEAITKYC